MGSYFKSISPLNESFSFTIKNLVDMFTIPQTTIANIKEKYNRVRKAYNDNYVWDDKTESHILGIIERMKEGNFQYEPIDILKMEKFYHLHFRTALDYDDHIHPNSKENLGNFSDFEFYALFYRFFCNASQSLSSIIGKYTYPMLVGGKYIVFIIFDEKTIENIYITSAQNELDLRSEVKMVRTKFDKNVFKK